MKRTRTRAVFECQDDGAIGVRHGSNIKVDICDTPHEPADLARPIHVTGIKSRDIGAMLGFYFIDEDFNLLSLELGYVVTRHEDTDNAILTPGDLVNSNPANWHTDHLDQLIKNLNQGEFAQFGLTNLDQYVASERTFRQPGPAFELPNLYKSIGLSVNGLPPLGYPTIV